jgi:hypothetical protein
LKKKLSKAISKKLPSFPAKMPFISGIDYSIKSRQKKLQTFFETLSRIQDPTCQLELRRYIQELVSSSFEDLSKTNIDVNQSISIALTKDWEGNKKGARMMRSYIEVSDDKFNRASAIMSCFK